MYRLVHFFLHSVISNYLIEMRMMMTMMVIIVIILCNLSRWEFYAYESFQWRCQTDYHCMNKVALKHFQRKWNDCIPAVMAVYRATKHESTGYSLNRLVLNKENRAPVNTVLVVTSEEEQHYDSYDDYVQDLQQRIREAYAIARDHFNAAAQRRKKEYDIKVKSMEFHEGDWVWYLYPRKYVNKSPKWNRNYQGPFLVIKVIARWDYVIQLTKKSTPITVHGDKLKTFHGNPPKSWLQPSSGSQQSQPSSTKNEEQEEGRVSNDSDQKQYSMDRPVSYSEEDEEDDIGDREQEIKESSVRNYKVNIDGKKLKKLEVGLPDKEKVKRKLKKFSWLSAFIVKQLRLWPNL